MKTRFLLFSLFATSVLFAQLKYPSVRKDEIYDGYFGLYKVNDPYRWLEDESSDETKAWVQSQNRVTFDYLASIPVRDKVKKRLEELWNYPRYSAPVKKGQYYYYFKNDGLQNQAVMYRQPGTAGKPEVFLDPNQLSKDGTAAIGSYGFSKSGKYFHYTISVAGSDWQEGYIMETATRKILPDTIRWIKFGGFSWYGDEGFYYSGYQQPDVKLKLSQQNQYNMVKYHRLGLPQDQDQLIYVDRVHPLRFCYAGVTEDNRFIILQTSEGTSGTELYFINKQDKNHLRFEMIVEGFNTEADVIDNHGNKMLLLTNDGAPNYQVVSITPIGPEEREEKLEKMVKDALARNLSTEEQKKLQRQHEINVMRNGWKVIIPEKKMALQSVTTCGGFLFASYLQDASTRVYQYTYDGKLVREVKLPGIGSASGFRGERNDKELFYTFSSFNAPPAIYRYNLATGQSVPFRKTEVKMKTDDLVTEQVFFKSKDGARVPMFLTYKKGMVKNGNNPVLMYGYGGFNIPVTPSFSVSNAFFIEQGGIYVSVNLRGGSEYGEKWHKDGMLDKKQNVFDDFIAAAEFLIKEKYTNSGKLAIRGGSNGGLLVGAVMTQRPELFKVALPAVGVMDMLRFHKFTVGWGWAVEYGNPDSASHFPFIYKYSPYHNLKPGTKYPATLVTTADHDDRVVPAHSYKFISRLQEYHAGDNPVLIRIETKAGHGTGKPTSKQIDEAADTWSFVMHNLGMEFKEAASPPARKAF
jgi:prolyl oligopeptidase